MKHKQKFNSKSHGKPGTYAVGCRCDACYKAHSKWQRLRRERYAANLEAYKNKPCMDCGNSFPPCCMDFDHRPDTTKVKCIAQLATNPTKLAEEIAKCDLVCANCHRIRTFLTKRKKGYNTRRVFHES